jgi:SNF2 family DNA or RNA helicase
MGHRFLTTARHAILADDMGCGKTIQVVSAIRESGPDSALPALVICPNSVKHQWAEEADIWHSGATPYVIDGGAATRRKLFEKAADDPTALIIINIEAVRIHSRLAPYGSVRLLRCLECGGQDPDFKVSRCEKHDKELNDIPFKTVVVDEAHRIKDPSSKQTRACWAAGHQASVTRRYALTGTPIATDIGDLWSILHFIAPNEHPRRGSYIERYCLLGWNAFGAMEILGLRPDTKEEFFRIVNPRFRRMPKSLVLPQLPEKIFQRRDVPLTPKQRKAYNELESTLVTRLDDGRRVVATNNLTNTIRLLQLASSYVEVNDSDGSVRMCDPSPKLDELMIVDEQIVGQYVVSAESRQLIEMAANRLEAKYGPDAVLQITGAIPTGIREANKAAFQGGNARVLLFTLKAGGTGLNLTAAHTMVRLQRSWSMLDNKQALDRVHRIGSERHDVILVIDLVADDTIEHDQIVRYYLKYARLQEINRDKQTLIEAGRRAEADALDAEEMSLLGSDLSGREELMI